MAVSIFFFYFSCPPMSGVSYRDILNNFHSVKKKKNNPKWRSNLRKKKIFCMKFFCISSTSSCPYHLLTSHNVLLLSEPGYSLLQTLTLINWILLQDYSHFLLKWICLLESAAGRGTGQLGMCGRFCRPRRFDWMRFLNTCFLNHLQLSSSFSPPVSQGVCACTLQQKREENAC